MNAHRRPSLDIMSDDHTTSTQDPTALHAPEVGKRQRAEDMGDAFLDEDEDFPDPDDHGPQAL